MSLVEAALRAVTEQIHLIINKDNASTWQSEAERDVQFQVTFAAVEALKQALTAFSIPTKKG